MERNLLSTKQKVVIGQRIHCILYGGHDGIIYNIRGEQKPATIGTMCGVVSFGGNASFDIVFDDGHESLGLPESILHGVQWRIYEDVANDAEILAARGFVVLETQRRKDEQEAKQKAFAEAVAGMKTNPEYAHLQQGDDCYSGKLAAKNIRTELKRAFPSVKFSVRKEHYGSVCINWTDGPRGKQVDKIVAKYSSAHFDGMQDLEEIHASPFNVVFGGSKYISTQREVSVERYRDAARHIAFECELPLLVIASSGSYGYVERSENSETRVPFSVHLDFETGEPTLCSDSQCDYYGNIVRSWAYALSY